MAPPENQYLDLYNHRTYMSRLNSVARGYLHRFLVYVVDVSAFPDIVDVISDEVASLVNN